jgi:hypothetical protein
MLKFLYERRHSNFDVVAIVWISALAVAGSISLGVAILLAIAGAFVGAIGEAILSRQEGQ